MEIQNPAYAAAKAARADVETRLRIACERLQAVAGDERGSMGLTPDHVKARPEWKAAFREMESRRSESARFNAWFARTFKKEYAAERAAERAARLAALA
jgi:hypothetical protein